MNKNLSTTENKIITRGCAVCGKKISVTVFPDKKYTGGHYFGKILPEDIEYWECDKCFMNEEEVFEVK